MVGHHELHLSFQVNALTSTQSTLRCSFPLTEPPQDGNFHLHKGLLEDYLYIYDTIFSGIRYKELGVLEALFFARQRDYLLPQPPLIVKASSHAFHQYWMMEQDKYGLMYLSPIIKPCTVPEMIEVLKEYPWYGGLAGAPKQDDAWTNGLMALGEVYAVIDGKYPIEIP